VIDLRLLRETPDVVREAYAHPGNIFDAAAVHAVITADRNGRALLGWSSSSN